MTKYLTGYLIKRDDFDDLDSQVINFEDTLDNIRQLVNCDWVEMPTRLINGKPYIFIVDEEGLFNHTKPINAYSSDGKEFLVGNILIVGLADREGNLTSLTTDDILNIVKATHTNKEEHLLVYQY